MLPTEATNHLTTVYLVYAGASLLLTIWLARTLFKNGEVFLEEVFADNPRMASSVNHLLVVGFYLLNLGYAFVTLKADRAVVTTTEGIETLAVKLGFRDEAQVRWFRCVLFVPYVVAIGGLVLILAIAKLSGEHPPELLGTIAIGTVLVAGATFLFTPPIWLLRALHLWFSNRQTRRILAAVQGPGLDGGRGPRAALSYRRPTAGSLAPSRVRPGSGS